MWAKNLKRVEWVSMIHFLCLWNLFHYFIISGRLRLTYQQTGRVVRDNI